MRWARRPLREAQSTASPAIRITIQPAPIVGQVLARASRTAIATPASPSATSAPGMVAPLGQYVRRDRLLVLGGHDQDGREVDEDPRAAEQREDDEPEPEDGRVEVEVASEAAADAGDPFVVRAALEPLDLGGVCDVFAHVSRLPASRPGGYPASPWSDPQRYSRVAMGEKLIAENRRARHDYHLLDRFEAGLVLTGTEVKSLRDGRATLAQAYADIRDGEAWLNGLEISTYDQGNRANHEPMRARKLLLHRREIDSLYGKVREKGLTIVPTRLYFKDSRVKIELAVARGKEQRDKRRDVVERDAKRQMERALKSRR